MGSCQAWHGPGGNLTGVSVDPGLEIWGKRFELFQEVIPTLSRLGILALRENPERAAILRTVQKAGVAVVGPPLEGSSEADYRRFFAATSQQDADGLIVESNAEHVARLTENLFVTRKATRRIR